MCNLETLGLIGYCEKKIVFIDVNANDSLKINCVMDPEARNTKLDKLGPQWQAPNPSFTLSSQHLPTGRSSSISKSANSFTNA